MSAHRWRSDESLTDEPLLDPGAGGAIPVNRSGVVQLTNTAADTRTMAAPGFALQIIYLCMDTYVGNTVITLPAAAVSDANLTTTITFTAAGQSVALIGGYKGGLKVWAVLQNNGATLG